MSVEDIRSGRSREVIHKRWADFATLLVVLTFIAYILTQCFWVR